MTDTEVLNDEISSYKTNEKQVDSIEQSIVAEIAVIIVLVEQFLKVYGTNAIKKPMSIKRKETVLMSIPNMDKKTANAIARAYKSPYEVIKHIIDVQTLKIKGIASEKLLERLMKVAIKNVKSKSRYLRLSGKSRENILIDKELIEKIIFSKHVGNNPDNNNWSNVLDNHMDDIKKLLMQSFNDSLFTPGGRLIFRFNPEQISKKITRHVRNILRNETSRIIGELNAKVYEEYGIEEYIYVSIIDDVTTDTCLKLDGNIYKLKERLVGVNASPMHFNCRSTEIPIL